MNIQYVAVTSEPGIWYTNTNTNTIIASFSASDWNENVDDRNNTIGDYYFLSNMVSWADKKLNFVFEYIASTCYFAMFVWLNHMLDNYGMERLTLTIFSNIESVFYISENYVQQSITNHIRFRHQLFWYLIEKNIISPKYVPILKQAFSEVLDFESYSFLRKSLSVFYVVFMFA